MADFAPAIAILLEHEGGFAERDAGRAGCVNRGLTQRRIMDTKRAQTWEEAYTFVKEMTLEEARGIYKDDYWDKHQLGKIDSQRFATVLFSTMANMGEGTAVKNLQKALGITADGKLGPLTLASLNGMAPAEVEEKWKQRLVDYYTQIAPRVGPRYLKGWLARVDELFGESDPVENWDSGGPRMHGISEHIRENL